MELRGGDKMKKIAVIITFLGWVLLLVSPVWAAAGEMPYGHVSYFEGDVQITRLDGRIDNAIINMPLVPGDLISTGSDGRLEFQFDNGTIFRLDRDTELKLITVLAPSLTSKWKITTLDLLRGQSYSINQSYRLEMFQVTTPKVSVYLKNSSTTVIAVKADGETRVACDRGRAKVMFGRDIQALKEETVRSGRGFRITADDRMMADERRDAEFWAWNKKINKDFEDLHYGISNVPKVVYRYSPGLVHWAEKWSTTYGEWIYNDLFGYVWKPAADIFADRRPFFNADYVRINGKLFLVPQQAWGWAPAYMGTWHWSGRSGWIWIPGEVFSDHIWSWGTFNQHWMWSGMFPFSYWLYPYQIGGMYTSRDDLWGASYPFGTMMGDFPVLDDWLFWMYGDMELYNIYRLQGKAAWREMYIRKNGMIPPDRNMRLNSVPGEIRGLIKKIDRAALEQIQPEFRMKGGTPFRSVEPRWITPAVPAGNKPARTVTAAPAGGTENGHRIVNRQNNFRDWNPDLRLTIAYGEKIDYSSARNDTVLSNHHIFARDLTPTVRSYLGHSAAGDVRMRGGPDSWGGRMVPGGSSNPSSSGSQGEPRMMNGSHHTARAKEDK
jgi:hypothetical protein